MLKGQPNPHVLRTCSVCGDEYSPQATNQRWCRRCVPSKNWSRFASEYNIGKPQWDELLVAQGGLCALCPAIPTMVDHRHSDGAVRGLLCRRCNTLLAGVDDARWLVRATGYAAQSVRPGAAPAPAIERYAVCGRGHQQTHASRHGCVECRRLRRRARDAQRSPEDRARVLKKRAARMRALRQRLGDALRERQRKYQARSREKKRAAKAA